MSDPTVRIGVLAPLSPLGWVGAGRQLVAGMDAAARNLGGIELVVRDTAADPERAAAAADELADLGVAALAGEFHSVAARAVAARAVALGLPFLCSSAVLDALTDEPTDLVARLAAPQSRGWSVYVDFLLAKGHGRVAVAAQPSVYWAEGTRILRGRLPHVSELDPDPATIADRLAADGATALLLLAGHPEPSLSIARAVRSDPRLREVLVGAPAGQPELAEWVELGAGIPFLRYRPEELTPLGARVEARLGGPSFVALEGYDAILVLAAALRAGGQWAEVDVTGTRGRIRFTRAERVWQWQWPVVQVAARDGGGFRVLHAG